MYNRIEAESVKVVYAGRVGRKSAQCVHGFLPAAWEQERLEILAGWVTWQDLLLAWHQHGPVAGLESCGRGAVSLRWIRKDGDDGVRQRQGQRRLTQLRR